MKKSNLISAAYVLGIPTVVIMLALFLPNKQIEGSYHYSIIDKTDWLEKASSPRIVLIGGSNLSFGIDSRMIRDRTGYQTVNMGIQGGHGLRFGINHVSDHIKKGDIIIVSPEYRNYYGSALNGDKVILYVLLDAYPEAKKYIPLSQWLYLSQFFPKYAIEKINRFFEYYLMPNQNNSDNQVYKRSSYNRYGDVNAHWTLDPPKVVNPYKSPRGEYNPETIDEIQKFSNSCVQKGARVFVTFPGIQEKSYDNMGSKIDLAYRKLQESNLQLLGSPEKYRFADKYLFNTAYHLNKEGVDIRTMMVIEDLNQAMYQ